MEEGIYRKWHGNNMELQWTFDGNILGKTIRHNEGIQFEYNQDNVDDGNIMGIHWEMNGNEAY